jgi:CBS domain-containing protein
MKVADVMVRDVSHCTPDTKVSTAAAILKEMVCGILPVVSEGRIVGVASDRDLLLALAAGDLRPSEVTVGQAMTTKVHTTSASSELSVAMATMKVCQLRRLPVVDDSGHVVGIISASDIVWHTDERPNSWNVSFRDAIETVQQATARRRHTKKRG